jgi:hypothetical protein
MTTLVFDMQTAFFHSVTGKATEVMASLSIKWEEAHPQPIFAAWKFIGCTNVPEVLPAYLSKLDVDAAAAKRPSITGIAEQIEGYGAWTSPVNSCFCQNCEAHTKEIQALKSTNAELLQAITKTVQENLHLADGDNCTLVHLVRALGPDDPDREAPLTREELRAMWIKRETGWDFYVNVDARLFGRKDTTTINSPKDANV